MRINYVAQSLARAHIKDAENLEIIRPGVAGQGDTMKLVFLLCLFAAAAVAAGKNGTNTVRETRVVLRCVCLINYQSLLKT